MFRNWIIVGIILTGFTTVGIQEQDAEVSNCSDSIVSSENDLLAYVSETETLAYHVYQSSLFLMDLATNQYCTLLEGSIGDVSWNYDTTLLDLRCLDGPYSTPCQVRADGTNFQRIDESLCLFYSAPKWSPDGTEMAYLCDNQLRTNNQNRPIIFQGATSFDWSPDGTRIVLSTAFRDSDPPDLPELVVVYPQSATPDRGAQSVRITDNNVPDLEPDWSPDGEFIAFVSRRGETDTLFIIDKDGEQETQITSSEISVSRPEWSPDGNRIFFTCDNRVCFYDLGSQNIEVVADVMFPSWCDAWQQSPDGTYILYLYDGKLYRYDLFTNETQHISTGNIRVCDFAIRPYRQ